jgi:hypothetical protein
MAHTITTPAAIMNADARPTVCEILFAVAEQPAKAAAVLRLGFLLRFAVFYSHFDTLLQR